MHRSISTTINQTLPLIFSCSANQPLANEIATILKLPSLGKIAIKQFSDSETQIEILENVRNRDLFIIQSTAKPVNDHLMELLLTIDALRRAGARQIIAVLPYFGYARQDKRQGQKRTPISAKVVADLLSVMKINQILTVDLHSATIQGFFNLPVDDLYGAAVFLPWVKDLADPVIVSPDIGGLVRSRKFAQKLNIQELAIVDKIRKKPNVAEALGIIGDVANRNCILIDDIIDTGGTLIAAADILKKHGAKSVIAFATHAVLSGAAKEQIADSALDQLFVTNTIYNSELSHKITSLSIAPLLADAILRIHLNQSLATIF